MIDQELSKHILSIGCKYNPPTGGIAQVVYNYSKYVYPYFGYVVNSGGKNKLIKLFLFLFAYCKTFLILLFRRRIKVVHIHTASFNSFKRSSFFVGIAKTFHKKVILHMHGGAFKNYYKTNSKWITSVLDSCDTIIVLSNSWKEYFSNICTTNVEIVHNIIPQPNLLKVQKDEKFHFLFLGLLVQEKGIYDLLDVLSEHCSWMKDNNVQLDIAGSGDTQLLMRTIDAKNLSSFVKFYGFVSGNKKIELLNRCDSYVLPSYAEGQPVSILEAMSYGKPILSTNVGGIPELIENGINGYIVTPGDKCALFEKMQMLVLDEPKRTKMGMRSSEIVRYNYPDYVANEIENIYLRLAPITSRK